ncbi:MAG: DEAD/DEAH box helicase [Planctomycetes bacterium]|nr:DEAD/DEAH box helicase [Planctomycetota bacterium]
MGRDRAEVKAGKDLTLRDLLSRLTYVQACRLLGPNGKKLIQAGGAHPVDIESQVALQGDLFRLRLPWCVVTMTVMAGVRGRLRWNCTACDRACEHVGAAFSLILDEKTALGLAAPPPEDLPMELLDEKALEEWALSERRERARVEKMGIESMVPEEPWTDYLVSSAVSGKTYRVALRGWERGESYCSCPDFRKNTLGTCKHILHALDKLKKRFRAEVLKQPYERKGVSLHLAYGREVELRLLLPGNLTPQAARVVQPIADRAIGDLTDLLERLKRLGNLEQEVTIYPDAEEYIEQRLLQARLASKAVEIRKDPSSHPLRTGLLRVKLLPFQLDGIGFAVGAGRAVLADDMGLGKTVQGIGVAELLAREAGIRRVLVVCPATLKAQWRNEIERFSGRSCELVLGGAKDRPARYSGDSFFIICNYEQVLRDILAIERVPWDLIILDEGQRIKNWETKTSRIVKALKSRFALVLTGTPLENRLDDLYSVVEFIDDRRLGPAFRFFHRYRLVDEKGKVLGYKNLEELRERLRPILLRRTRQGVIRDLPPRTTEVVRITPTDEQKGLHDTHLQIVAKIVSKPFISEMDILRLQKALLMCRLAANGTYLVDKQPPGYSSKLEELDRLFEQLSQESDRKIVLFSEWTTMLDLVEERLEKRGLRFVRMDGSVPQKQRQSLVNAFQRDPAVKLFITTNAGSTGLNLQAANTVINVDLPWNPAVLEQRISRVHRMGQTQPVQVFVLVTEETLEEKLLTTLSAKHKLALEVLDPEAKADRVDMVSGMEELKRRLEVLLGAKPDAPVDMTQKAKETIVAAQQVQRERVSAAAGQLVGAAFAFLGQVMPSAKETEESRRLAQELQHRLEDGLERDEQGRLRLAITLPDVSALEGMAKAVAALLSRPGGGGVPIARV